MATLARDLKIALSRFSSVPITSSFKISAEQNVPRIYYSKLQGTGERIVPKVIHIPNSVTLEAIQTDKEYILTYLDIIKNLTEGDGCEGVKEGKQRLANILRNCLPYGRFFEGSGVVSFYKLIVAPENITDENIKLSHILGWCVAMVCATYVVEDDIMDEEDSRKGYPCWHKRDGVGLRAINDSTLMANAIFIILKRYFSNHECFVPTIELFHATNGKTAVGQAIDMMCTVSGQPKFNYFTWERLNHISKYKTTFFSFIFPIRLAMYLAGKYDTQLHANSAKVLLLIGSLYQQHNDFEDAFGGNEAVGKHGTDIRNGKCTRFSVEALMRGTHYQRRIFMEHYGKYSVESLEIVQSLYETLRFKEDYIQFQNEAIELIREEIANIPDRVIKLVLSNYMNDFLKYKDGYR